jgi:hypothetical protein
LREGKRVDGLGADKLTPPGSERERGKGERAQEGADKQGLPVREGWRARGGWAG